MNRLVLAVALVLLAGCQMPGSPQGCGNVQIDWVDFIQIGSTQYVAGSGSFGTLLERDLGPEAARVKFKVAGNVCDPSYHPKDGDAAFLDPGTAIYEVNGHPKTEVLAARHDGQIVAYVAKSP